MMVGMMTVVMVFMIILIGIAVNMIRSTGVTFMFVVCLLLLLLAAVSSFCIVEC